MCAVHGGVDLVDVFYITWTTDNLWSIIESLTYVFCTEGNSFLYASHTLVCFGDAKVKFYFFL